MSYNNAVLALLALTLLLATLGLAPGTRTLTEIKPTIFAAGSFLTALLLVLGVLYRRPARLSVGLAAVCSGYLLFTAFSFLWASHPWAVSYALLWRFIYILFAVSTAVGFSDVRTRGVFRALYVALGAAVAIFSLCWHGFYTHSLNDMKAPFGNANLLAVFMLLPLAMTASGLLTRRREGGHWRVRLLFGSALLLQLLVFALCRSLSGWVGLGVLAFFLVCLRAKRPLRLAAGATALVAAAVIVLMATGMLGRFTTTRTYLLRAEYWRRAGRMALQRPLGGWGAGNFFTDNQALAPETSFERIAFNNGAGVQDVPLYEVLGNHHPSSPHNEYLQHAAEGGAAGLGIYLALVAAPLWLAVRARKRPGADRAVLDFAIAAYLAFLFTNAVTKNMHYAGFAAHFWALAGFLAAHAAGAAPEREAPFGGLRLLSRLVLGIAAVALAAFGVWRVSVLGHSGAVDYQRGNRLLSKTLPGRPDKSFQRAHGRATTALMRAKSLHGIGRTHLWGPAADPQSAYHAFKRLNAMVEGYAEYELGRALERLGRYDEALAAYEKHALLRPADPRAHRGKRIVEDILAARDADNEKAPGRQ